MSVLKTIIAAAIWSLLVDWVIADWQFAFHVVTP